MKSFQQELKEVLRYANIPHEDHTSEFGELDFSFRIPGADVVFHLDVKEKRQKINCRNWNLDPACEEYTFIIDDLAARKALRYAPCAGIAVRDNLRSRYYIFTVVDLFSMQKRRVNRPINKHRKTCKGKWIIDLRNGERVDNVRQILEKVLEYVESFDEIFGNHLPCYGDYVDEEINLAGEVRRPGHWRADVRETK